MPGELSGRGRQLARELGARRRNDNLDAVFVSDLARAVETASIAFDGCDIPIHQDMRLRECNYGALNGMPAATLATLRASHVDVPFPEGQNYRDVVAQMSEFLDELSHSHLGRVLVISHSANRWALDHLLHGIPLEHLG